MNWRGRVQVDREPMPIDEEPDNERTRQNVHAAIMLILLFLGGLWLVFAFRNYVKTEECLEAGHRNCAPLDVPNDLQSDRGR
jgi:hypothetical protein